MAEIEASLLAKIQTATVDGKPALFGLLHARKKYVETLIEAANGQTLKDLKKAIKKNGGKKLKLYPEINTIYAELPVDHVEKMSAASCVLHIYDANAEVKAMLYESVPFVMGVDRIELPYRVRGKAVEGKGVKVAVIDSGIDHSHPDFGWRIKASKNFSGGRASHGTEHGTHVAGIIAGSGKSSGYRYAGVAPKALLYDAKVFINSQTGTTRDTILEATRWAIQKKVDVINMSFGDGHGCADGTCPLCKMANYAVSKGITVVAAAGNNGPAPGTITCPGTAKDVITVGASTKTAPGMVMGFSSRGSSAQPNKPDVVAPGQQIMAPQPNAEYGEMSGTSMATPHVSGMAALLHETRQYIKQTGKTTPASIKEMIKQGSIDIGEHASAQGSGLINFHKELTTAFQQSKRPFWHLQRKKHFAPIMTVTETEHVKTCPAALNMFCPHYDESVCNSVYEQCIHFRRAQCQKLLQPQ